jgi:hypothetical protein
VPFTDPEKQNLLNDLNEFAAKLRLWLTTSDLKVRDRHRLEVIADNIGKVADDLKRDLGIT